LNYEDVARKVEIEVESVECGEGRREREREREIERVGRSNNKKGKRQVAAAPCLTQLSSVISSRHEPMTGGK
jgi:hypothetical protein